MPDDKLCISDGLKRSLTKMRENLFQRRLNLAVFEKGVAEWSMPDIYAEVHKRKRDERKGVQIQWTQEEYEKAAREGRPRPCEKGCGFQATFLEKLCCKACNHSGKHGPKCQRLAMPGITPRNVVLTDK